MLLRHVRQSASRPACVRSKWRNMNSTSSAVHTRRPCLSRPLQFVEAPLLDEVAEVLPRDAEGERDLRRGWLADGVLMVSTHRTSASRSRAHRAAGPLLASEGGSILASVEGRSRSRWTSAGSRRKQILDLLTAFGFVGPDDVHAAREWLAMPSCWRRRRPPKRVRRVLRVIRELEGWT
jgi:hypothetical protein